MSTLEESAPTSETGSETKTAGLQTEVESFKGSVQEKVVQGSSAFVDACLSHKPNPWSRNSIHLYGIALVGLVAGAMVGIDESIMSALLVMPMFQKTFGADVDGSRAGLVTAMFQIGSVSAILVIGVILDKLGRRAGLLFGSILVVIGAICQGTSANSAHPLAQFLVGRYIIGFGSSLALSAGPAFVVEISHPKYRGVSTALQSGIQNLGGFFGAVTTRFCSHRKTSNQSWQIPVLIQLIPAGIIICTIWFVPETPRWLYTHGRSEEAFAFLTKFHGEGDRNNPFVQLEIAEFESDLDLNGSDKRWWDYRSLYKTRAARMRVMNNLLFIGFGALSSGGIGYYMGAFYKSAGITNTTTVLNYNLGNTVQGSCTSVIGSFLAEHVGRRRLLLPTLFAMCMSWLGMTVSSSVVAKNTAKGIHNKSAGKAGIAFFYLFNMAYCTGITPLQGVYATELLSYEQRAKGTAVSKFVQNAFGLVTQFGTPVALKRIGWRTYIVWTIWNGCEFVISYFVHVETKGYTLEQLNKVFEAKNPRKESTRRKKLLIAENHVIEELE